jgi:hypothetical protein
MQRGFAMFPRQMKGKELEMQGPMCYSCRDGGLGLSMYQVH